jgi:hypothetical protein
MKVRQIKQRLHARRSAYKKSLKTVPLFQTLYVVYRNKDQEVVAEVNFEDEAQALVAKAKAAKKASLSYRRDTRIVDTLKIAA